MEKIELVRKRRRTTRGLVTKLLAKIEHCLEQERAEVDRRKLKQFQSDLTEKAECLKQLDATILDSLFDGDTDDETCAKEAEKADEIQGKIFFKLICIDELLEEIANDNSSSVASSRLQTSEPKPNDEYGSIAPSDLQRSESKESVPDSVTSGCSSHCSIVSPP